MHTKHDLLSFFISFSVFAILETTSILMIANNSIIQKIELFDGIRDFQTYFWNKKQGVDHYFQYKKANDALFEENVMLKNQLAAYQEQLFTAELTDVTDSSGYRYIGARVIKNTVNSQHNYMIINKGEKDGIESGMGVVTSRGAVGVVNSTSKHYSYVLSFLNITQNLSVKLASSNVFGPMSWDGISPKKATIREIPTHITIEEQDTVKTSGFSTIFPPQIPLGIVESVSDSYGLSQNVHVVLFEEFLSLDYVYVVANQTNKEIEELEKNEQ